MTSVNGNILIVSIYFNIIHLRPAAVELGHERMYSYRFRGAPAPNFSAHQDSDNLGKWTHYFPLSEAIYSGISSERLYVHELFPWDGMRRLSAKETILSHVIANSLPNTFQLDARQGAGLPARASE